MANLNLNKYSTRAAYSSATNRPANENTVSLADTEVIYDGINVMLTRNQLRRNDVCVVYYDSVTSDLVFIPIETYYAAGIDTNRYTLQNYIRFTRTMGRDVVMHKDAIGSYQWAINNRYKVYCNTNSAGGFTISVGNWGTTTTNTVSWSAGASLDSIVSQMTNGSYCWFSHESGEDFIRVSAYTSDNSYRCTLTNNTGGSVIDLSVYCRINGVQQSEVHRSWQGTDVASLFPGHGLVSPTTVQYAKNGYNLSWMCGGNLARYKAYYGTSGGTSYVAESSVAARMTESAFNALNNSSVTEQQALYDKYNGSWDAYMRASMASIDDPNTNGIEYRSYIGGPEQSAFLATVTTMDFDGSYIPAFPSAYYASSKTDTRNVLTFGLPSQHELAVFMEDDTFAKINTAMSAISGTALSNTAYYWSVAQYYSNYAWFYSGYNGRLDDYGKYYSTSARVLAYLN